MPIIRQLSSSLVNKIAAGEVIERPASVVKELLENSIDAGATRIELVIESGGLEMIRVSDNGCGIEEQQIPLAIASHATSKLVEADDLFDVRTLGFRGEALASIAEVSHFTLRTRTAECDGGAELAVRGGQADPLQPAGCPVGTTIEVRNLFFNTPVRRKFLRTSQTEGGHITEAFTRIALAYPQVQMSLVSGARTVYELAATDAWAERIQAFFGDEVASALIPVESSQDQTRLSGYVCDPTVNRSNNRSQYLFLNGRHIRDRSLQHALSEAYRGLMMVGRFPVCFLRMDIPPNMVDVNVHPTKMEVRFQDGGKVYSQLLQTLRHRFLTSDLTARVRHVPGPVPRSTDPERSIAPLASSRPSNDALQSPSNHFQADRWEGHTQKMLDVSATELLDLRHVSPFRPFPSLSLGGARQGEVSVANTDDPLPTESPLPPGATVWDPLSLNPSEQKADSSFEEGVASDTPGIETEQSSQVAAWQRRDESQTSSLGSHLGYQIHQRYLITQDEHGMVIIDQHALHERILYEQLRQKVEQSNLETQQLLVPEPLDLTSQEAAAALDSRELLSKIGINIEPFGGGTVLMTSYPAMLTHVRPVDLLRQVLEPLLAGGKEPSTRELLDELLHMLACKAAIKAGDKLSSEEITALLEQRHHFQDTHHCPHGRPTALFFSRQQLDKMFKRT
ncbi:MAG: DNA mismatch repair endonuclease MutL [Planctomycetales bacterium]|nr:DNA mismatch repair endonuclease MutL [Planctomycetales bacterium]